MDGCTKLNSYDLFVEPWGPKNINQVFILNKTSLILKPAQQH